MNTLYDAGLITLGAVGTSMLSKKLVKYNMGVSDSMEGIFKLFLAVGGGSLSVKYAQKMEYVPEDPWKE